MEITPDMIAQLKQLRPAPVWAGDLISKPATKKLIEAGLVEHGGQCPTRPAGPLQESDCYRITQDGHLLLDDLAEVKVRDGKLVLTASSAGSGSVRSGDMESKNERDPRPNSGGG
jgi:hypothetical protein